LNAAVGIGGQSTTSHCLNSVAHWACSRVRTPAASAHSRQPTLVLEGRPPQDEDYFIETKTPIILPA
jgi:hypothetical protein